MLNTPLISCLMDRTL